MNKTLNHDPASQPESLSAKLLVSALKKENLNLQKKVAKLEAKNLSLEQQVIALKAENRKYIREIFKLKKVIALHDESYNNLSDEELDLELERNIKEAQDLITKQVQSSA